MMIRIVMFLLSAVAAVSYSHNSKVFSPPSKETRRGFLSLSWDATFIASTSILLGPRAAFAEEDLVDYEDLECKFSIKVPTGWEKTVQSLPDRRKIVLYFKPDSDQKTFLFFAYTPLRSDFTSLGSFGSVDEVSLD